MAAFEFFKYERNVRTLSAGEVVFREGEAGDVMFAVLDGQIDVSRAGSLLASMNRGDVFGEMAIIDNLPRSATAVATVDSQVALIDAKRFQFLVQQTPDFALQMLRTLTERVRKHHES